MNIINPLRLALSFSLFSSAVLFQPALAIPATPAGQDVLHIHTGVPQRHHDSLFSYTAEWRMDDGEVYRSTGISFLKAAQNDTAVTGATIARKILTALKDGMIQLDPNWRGVTVVQPPEQAEVVIANKNGFSLTTVTVRDYSNQPLSYNLDNKSFQQDGVQIGLDLMYSAEVESKKSLVASTGEIEIGIDDQKPLIIKTDGKTTKQLEEEIARQLPGAHFSDKPLYDGMVSNDTRNNKPFDGGEVQLPHFAGKSIHIFINDPALGVLTKFKFKDENYTVKIIEPRVMIAALGGGSLLMVAVIWFRNRKKTV